MFEKITIKSYNDFQKNLEKYKEENKKILVYFGGSKDDEGKSWCATCNLAMEVIDQKLDLLNEEDTVFLDIEAGTFEEINDIKNPFRTDPNLKLKILPTLIIWNSEKRLIGGEILNENVVELFFKDSGKDTTSDALSISLSPETSVKTGAASIRSKSITSKSVHSKSIHSRHSESQRPIDL